MLHVFELMILEKTYNDPWFTVLVLSRLREDCGLAFNLLLYRAGEHIPFTLKSSEAIGLLAGRTNKVHFYEVVELYDAVPERFCDTSDAAMAFPALLPLAAKVKMVKYPYSRCIASSVSTT